MRKQKDSKIIKGEYEFQDLTVFFLNDKTGLDFAASAQSLVRRLREGVIPKVATRRPSDRSESADNLIPWDKIRCYYKSTTKLFTMLLEHRYDSWHGNYRPTFCTYNIWCAGINNTCLLCVYIYIFGIRVCLILLLHLPSLQHYIIHNII